MKRLARVTLHIALIPTLVLGSLAWSAGPAQAVTRTCKINWDTFKTARATNVACNVARGTMITWWTSGGENSACYTAKGCRVGQFHCGVTWQRYTGHGKCTASKGREITFTFG
jgi:hypothetical protein